MTNTNLAFSGSSASPRFTFSAFERDLHFKNNLYLFWQFSNLKVHCFEDKKEVCRVWLEYPQGQCPCIHVLQA
jgi:hypothetical protein